MAASILLLAPARQWPWSIWPNPGASRDDPSSSRPSVDPGPLVDRFGRTRPIAFSSEPPLAPPGTRSGSLRGRATSIGERCRTGRAVPPICRRRSSPRVLSERQRLGSSFCSGRLDLRPISRAGVRGPGEPSTEHMDAAGSAPQERASAPRPLLHGNHDQIGVDGTRRHRLRTEHQPGVEAAS